MELDRICITQIQKVIEDKYAFWILLRWVNPDLNKDKFYSISKTAGSDTVKVNYGNFTDEFETRKNIECPQWCIYHTVEEAKKKLEEKMKNGIYKICQFYVFPNEYSQVQKGRCLAAERVCRPV